METVTGSGVASAIAVFEALKPYLALLSYYIGSPLLAFVTVQYVKLWRAETSMPELKNYQIRAMATLFCYAIAVAIGSWGLEMEPLRVLQLSAIIALYYPLTIWALFTWAKKYNRPLYLYMRSRRAPKVGANDPDDLDVTLH